MVFFCTQNTIVSYEKLSLLLCLHIFTSVAVFCDLNSNMIECIICHILHVMKTIGSNSEANWHIVHVATDYWNFTVTRIVSETTTHTNNNSQLTVTKIQYFMENLKCKMSKCKAAVNCFTKIKSCHNSTNIFLVISRFVRIKCYSTDVNDINTSPKIFHCGVLLCVEGLVSCCAVR